MEKIRSFISVNIPLSERADALMKEASVLKGIAMNRSGTHMTLRFLGDVPRDRLEVFTDMMRNIGVHERFHMELEGVGAFPKVSDPRVIWIGVVPDPAIFSIVNDIDRMLRECNIPFDDRKFTPHITIGRVRSKTKEMIEFIDNNKDIRIGGCECSSIELMGSRLTKDGAVHSVISSVKLR